MALVNGGPDLKDYLERLDNGQTFEYGDIEDDRAALEIFENAVDIDRSGFGPDEMEIDPEYVQEGATNLDLGKYRRSVENLFSSLFFLDDIYQSSRDKYNTRAQSNEANYPAKSAGEENKSKRDKKDGYVILSDLTTVGSGLWTLSEVGKFLESPEPMELLTVPALITATGASSIANAHFQGARDSYEEGAARALRDHYEDVRVRKG